MRALEAPRTRHRWTAVVWDPLGGWAEVVLVAAAFALYLGVRAVTRASRRRAIADAMRVLSVEHDLHLGWERTIQAWMIGRPGVMPLLNAVYVWVLWPLVVGVLVVLHRRAPGDFVAYRNALIASGLAGLVVFAAFPVAPPRMLDGFVDTVAGLAHTHVVAHPAGLTDEYAALPSFHVGWTALACVAVGAHVRRIALRVLVAVPAVAMAVAVVATANHFVLDGIVGVVMALGPWVALRRSAALRSARARPLAASR
jgi:hypothetical protein